MARLYTHINWGGLFRIEDDGTLIEIVREPDSGLELFHVIQESGEWQPGENVLYGDDDLTDHFNEVPN